MTIQGNFTRVFNVIANFNRITIHEFNVTYTVNPTLLWTQYTFLNLKKGYISHGDYIKKGRLGKGGVKIPTLKNRKTHVSWLMIQSPKF